MRKKSVGLLLAMLVLFLYGWQSTSLGAPVLQASPSLIKPGEKILLSFSGAPGNKTDWIAIYLVGAKGESYGEWYYLGGKINGELTFTAPPKEGNYELRLLANWPKGKYEAIATSNIVKISMETPAESYRDVFRLSTGELIAGELLSFKEGIFKIKTEKGIIEKNRADVTGILITTAPLAQGELLSQWASKAEASSEYSNSRWSAQQAIGEPNTSKCGDIDTSWAPRGSGSQLEWLKLTFNTPVYAKKLRVHETYNAGFIQKVEFIDNYGKKHIVWQDKDNTPCPGWFEIIFEQTSYLVKSVILHTQIKGYEEIDAVKLTGIAPIK